MKRIKLCGKPVENLWINRLVAFKSVGKPGFKVEYSREEVWEYC